jgi:hypothetical protein
MAREVFFFRPTSIPGCQLWLDAADTTTLSLSGSNVTQWNDKSGNVNNAFVTTSANQPTYANNRLTFSGEQYLLTPLNSRIEAQTLFAVVSTSATETSQRAVLGQNGVGLRGGYSFYLATGGSLIQRVHTWGGDPGFNGAVLTRNQVFLYGATVVSSTGSGVLYANGSVSASGSVASLASSAFTYIVGAGLAEGGEPLQGTLSELLLWNSVLTTSQRQLIEGYLMHKWGLVGSLPSNHPFKITSPLSGLPLALLPSPRFQLTNRLQFTPRQIPDCALWLDAADYSTLSLSGANVTQWNDKSGNGNNTVKNISYAAPTYANTGLNGRPTLTFATSLLQTPSLNPSASFTSGGTDTTIFAIVSTTVDGGSVAGSLFGLSTTDNNYVSRSPWGGGRKIVDIGSRMDFSFITNGNYMLSIMRIGPDMSMFLNGTLIGSAWVGFSSLVTTTSQPLNIGLGTIASANWFPGSLSEFIIYKNGASTLQRQQVEGYLAWKWGLQTNLPVSHPYRRRNPLILPAVALNSLPQLKEATFNPRTISACVMWLDATDLNGNGTQLRNGSFVSTWVDKSGSGNNATTFNNLFPTFFSRSIYTKLPFVQFNATNWSNNTVTNVTVMSLPNFQNTLSVSCFYVCLANATHFPANYMRPLFLYKGVFGGVQVYLETGPSQVGITLGNPTIDRRVSVTGVGNTVFLNSAVFNSAARTFSGGQNGTNTTLSTGLSSWNETMTTPGSWRSISLGAYFDTSLLNFQNAGFNGELYEVLMFNTPLTTFQRQQVEGYLAWKWGLEANLPSTHPFKRFPPSP